MSKNPFTFPAEKIKQLIKLGNLPQQDFPKCFDTINQAEPNIGYQPKRGRPLLEHELILLHARQNAPNLYIFHITPMGAPRMSSSDRWKKRPVTTRYWAYKDKLKRTAKELNFALPVSGLHVTFYLPMPDSWSAKKKAKFDNTPHQQKCDIDNLQKSVLDCLLDEDKTVWDIRATKYWAKVGRIEFKVV